MGCRHVVWDTESRNGGGKPGKERMAQRLWECRECRVSALACVAQNRTHIEILMRKAPLICQGADERFP
jgi:ribosomal protein L37AE/L43A